MKVVSTAKRNSLYGHHLQYQKAKANIHKER